MLKASVRPLVQLNILGGLFDEPKTGQRMELPDNINERADPNAGSLAKEQMNSPTHLLAAAFSYKVLKKFRGGTTQQDVQEQFSVRPKQLANCLTRKKYLGGSDRRTLERKRKTSGDDGEPLSSKRPATE